MASGTIKGSFSGTATSNVYPEIRWRSTSNTANNNSSVTAELWFVKVNSYWYPYNLAGYTCGISINGNNASALRTIDMRSTWSQKIWERTVTVGHNADGAKSITISTSGNTGLNLGTVRVSGTAKLDSIPRASSISSITGNQLGGNITVNISRASSSFTHRVGYYDTDGQRRSAIQDATTSTVFSVPLDRCSLLPNSTSGTAKIVVDTYSGGTRIGSTSKNHTVYVPASVVPTTPSLTVVENIAAVKNLNLGATTFVQNKSQLGMTSSASGIYGSSIRDYTFSYNGASQGGTVGRAFNVGNVSGTREVKVVVTDSRGRKAERKFNINILAYSPPRINGFGVWRENNGTIVKANVNYTVSNIGGKGGIWYVDYQEGSNWPLKNTGTFTTTYNQNITIAGSYVATRSHTFRTNLHDAFGSGATATSTVSTAKVLMDLNKDVGIGIGKMHERGTLDVGGNTHINGNLMATGYHTLTAGSTASNGNDAMLQLNRTNNTATTVFTSSAEGHLAMHLYNKSGTWTRNHNFRHDGKVELSGDLDVQYWVYAKQFVQGSNHIYTDRPNGVLWTGALWMDSNQVLNLPKTIDQAPNGWILVMQAFENNAVVNRDFTYTVLHKSHPTNIGFHVPVYWDHGDKQAGRYMYLRTRSQLGGARTNAINSAQGGGMVLSKVIEF